MAQTKFHWVKNQVNQSFRSSNAYIFGFLSPISLSLPVFFPVTKSSIGVGENTADTNDTTSCNNIHTRLQTNMTVYHVSHGNFPLRWQDEDLTMFTDPPPRRSGASNGGPKVEKRKANFGTPRNWFEHMAAVRQRDEDARRSKKLQGIERLSYLNIDLPKTRMPQAVDNSELKWMANVWFTRHSTPLESHYSVLFRVFLVDPPRSHDVEQGNLLNDETGSNTGLVSWRNYPVPSQTRIHSYRAPNGGLGSIFGDYARREVYARVESTSPDDGRHVRRTSPWLVVVYLFGFDLKWLRTADLTGDALPRLFVEATTYTSMIALFEKAHGSSREKDWWAKDPLAHEAERRLVARLIGQGQSIKRGAQGKLPRTKPCKDCPLKDKWCGL